MTTREWVQQTYPNAYCDKRFFVHVGTRHYIWSRHGIERTKIGEGGTPEEAWRDAVRTIRNRKEVPA